MFEQMILLEKLLIQVPMPFLNKLKINVCVQGVNCFLVFFLVNFFISDLIVFKCGDFEFSQNDMEIFQVESSAY